MTSLKIPEAPNSIQKGVPLKMVLDAPAVNQLASNLNSVYSSFDKKPFIDDCLNKIEPLSLTERSKHISFCLRNHLPSTYSDGVDILLKSLTPRLDKT